MMPMLPQLVVSGLLIGGIYALISVGLTLIFGVMRMVNFAHGEFIMLAMYMSFWLFHLYGIDPYVSLLVTVPAMFVIGVVVYLVIMQRIIAAPHVVQIFATLGLSITLQNLVLVIWKGDFRFVRPAYGDQVILLGSTRLNVPLVVAFVVALVFIGVLYAFLRVTYPGKAVRATAQDRDAALLMGIDIGRIYLLTFAIGLACVGVAGALLSPLYPIYPTMGLPLAIIAYVVVVLGGLGSIGGALLGGLIVGLVETFSGFYVGTAWKEVSYFIMFILVLLLRPAGLFGQRGAEELAG
jgi:branched-chain amino acid transport system permease protein